MTDAGIKRISLNIFLYFFNGFIEELVRIDRNVIKLIMKIIPIMEHHIYTRHGMSKEKYGGVEDPHAGT